ncbi:hypothetical protein [Hymenobacter nivis]|uniref:Uncharacterized protein n=1 Tax=Hymenobacter nivis TaxID=1850093 RepID=A0A502HE21_9BACT|nr:hypothetical protein [Hymenobacter nivis]TPG71723.1 hypothetical protein EAH73_00230 [Hymenobacter nivis]
MLENIQRYFRYYLALVLATLLALGMHLAPAAPLPAAATGGPRHSRAPSPGAPENFGTARK